MAVLGDMNTCLGVTQTVELGVEFDGIETEAGGFPIVGLSLHFIGGQDHVTEHRPRRLRHENHCLHLCVVQVFRWEGHWRARGEGGVGCTSSYQD